MHSILPQPAATLIAVCTNNKEILDYVIEGGGANENLDELGLNSDAKKHILNQVEMAKSTKAN